MTRRIAIFDTTLRDGEQAPGYSMTGEAKLRMARALAALRVDVIEAGFAAASPGDAAAIERIAQEIEGPVICSLSRAAKGDILAAFQALKPARRRRIHIFLGTSPLHREAKLHLSRSEVLARIGQEVARARELFDEVEFSAEDAIRTERDFLVEALSTAAAAGARILNVPDTVGYTTPDEIHDLFSQLIAQVDRPADAIFSAHCHNDLGMAVANSLAAARAGAAQIECTVNGIGERAGNCALEDAVMALKTRADHFGLETNIETRQIMAATRTLSKLTNIGVARNKPVVGANAFAHEAGIHQHGVLANRATYEIMTPEDIGRDGSALILGKHSGRHALAARAADLGFQLSEDQLGIAFQRLKAEADDGRIIDDGALEAILTALDDGIPANLWNLARLEIRSALHAASQPVARVELDHTERGRICDLAAAPGALDAAFRAVSQILELEARVEALDLHYFAAEPDQPAADGQGADVSVQITVDVEGAFYTGRARARDVVPACVSAYIDALNNARTVRRRRAAADNRAAAAA
ncbi:MAG: 2-isopropylmalate synthase [Rhodothalassiaceae bacterium]